MKQRVVVVYFVSCMVYHNKQCARATLWCVVALNMIKYSAAITYSLLASFIAYIFQPYAVFDNIDCSNFDPNYGEVMECWLMPDSSGQLTMSAIIVLKQDLADINCKYRFIIERNTRNVTYLSLDIDICNALAALFQNPVLALTTSELRRVSNLPLECPLKKGVKYIVNNFTINSKYIPTFAPVMKWIVNGNFYTGIPEKKILQFDNSGRVIRNPRRA